MDKYGRKVGAKKAKKEMEKLYEIQKDDDESGDEEAEGEGLKLGADDTESGDDDNTVRKELSRVGADMSAEEDEESGEDEDESSSSESSSDSDEDAESEEVEEMGLRVEEKEVPMGEVSSRLAAVNLDWDNIRAADLMAVATSFVPQDGRILNVTVYPSEFGCERMQREEMEGPPPEIFPKSKRKATAAQVSIGEDEDDGSNGSEDSEDDAQIRDRLLQSSKAEDFDSTELRRYQLDRLRYYYAVITCSSSGVGKALYDAMDGREYLSSANFFDLRFVPDDVSFDEDKPRDECKKVPEGYRPAEFVTDALQHSKVRLTWDEDDRERKDLQKRAFSAKKGKKGKKGNDGPAGDDLAAYIASGSSGEESSDEEEQKDDDATVARNRFGIEVAKVVVQQPEKSKSKQDKAAALRAALGLEGAAPSKRTRQAVDDKPAGNMQVTFAAGLSGDSGRGSVFVNEPEETTDQKYIRQEKERKARRKEKAKARKAAENGTTVDADEDVEEEESADIRESALADDPFNDPFFEDPVNANRDAAKKAKKTDKERLKREREVEEKTNAKQRAELELLMAEEDGQNGAGQGVRHFDINELAKAEKDKKKRKKHRKRHDEVDEGKEEADVDAFKMQVDDPRFSRLFESHEFAIDPTDPRFKGTEGMKALLEEGRRRGKRKVDALGERGERDTKKSRNSRTEGDDVMKLVQKVKGRS